MVARLEDEVDLTCPVAMDVWNVPILDFPKCDLSRRETVSRIFERETRAANSCGRDGRLAYVPSFAMGE
jgi:hypothetical protein